MQFKTPTQLADVWPEITQLLALGYSLIPVRDKETKDFKAKTPFGLTWKDSQRIPLKEPELWTQMADTYVTNAVAVVCGTVSGNLEVIDIDNKNKAGVDAEIFAAIEKFYPAVWARLRIHKSPSGGFHILYKCTSPVPGSRHLAKRVATDAELAANPKAKFKVFIETKGEGGYVLLPPSLGYSIHKNNPVPVITWEERTSIIAICETFNEFIKPQEKQDKPTQRKSDYYDVDPWRDFNLSSQAEQVLTNNGWTEFGRNARFIWYSRPGGSRTIHAAFLRDSRYYYFFTTNTEFDSEKCYQPATVLSALEDNWNKKITYRKLVDGGYGKISTKAEQRIIRAAPLVVPNNITVATKEAIKARHELYPYGRFWHINPEDESISISRIDFYRVAEGFGFRLYQSLNQIVLVKNGRVYKSNDRELYDTLRNYIQEPQGGDIVNAYEGFVQRSGKFSLTRIQLLKEDMLVRDTRNICFKFYRDIWLKITATEVEEHGYEELKGRYVWADQIQDRDYRPGEAGKFVDFLEKSLEYTLREKYIQLIIGYLAHNYKDETTGYIPVLVEQIEDPTAGGGTGKNLFCNLLKYTTTITSIPGDQIRYDDNLLQSWDGERIFIISDLPKDFKFIFLKEPSTGSVKINKKYINAYVVPCEDMCKFVLQTNYSYEIKDGGLRRRIVPLEFTDFFTLAGGVDTFYGSHFPNGWTEEDWSGYDGTIVTSIQTWLRSGLKIKASELTETGWRKQFEVTYGFIATEFINEHFEYWVEQGEVRNDIFQKELQDFYVEKDVQRQYHLSSHKINRAILMYCNHHKIDYISDVKKRENGVQYKCRQFVRKNDEAPF